MSELTLADLNNRLAAAEQRAAATHAEIVALRSRASHSAIALVMLALIAALGWSRSTMHAQSVAEPLTVRAPFVVVNGAGQAIMEVNDYGGAQGFLIRNARGMVAVQVGTLTSGAGIVLARNGTTPDGAPHAEKGPMAALLVRDDGGALHINGNDGAIVTIKEEGMKVRGPVEVLDARKKPVITLMTSVDNLERGITVANARKEYSTEMTVRNDGSGIIVANDGKGAHERGSAGIQVDNDGNGLFGLTGPDGFGAEVTKKSGFRLISGHKAVAQITAEDEGRGRISVLENGVDRVSLAITSKNNAALFVTNSRGERVAEMGSSHDLRDGGSLVIRDANGAPAVTAAAVEARRGQVTVNSGDRAAASMVVLANGLGAVQAFNRDGQPVSVLSSGARGDGLMQLSDVEGQAMVEAGTIEQGVGVVRTGPMGRKSGTGMLGVPGSFLIGKKE